MILKRMKRRHLRDDRHPLLRGNTALAGHRVRRHHRRLPDRDGRDVRKFAKIVEECGLTHLHVFPFSPRKGTPAARMPQVERGVIKQRARLRAVGDAAYARHLASLAGTTQSVLIEREGPAARKVLRWLPFHSARRVKSWRPSSLAMTANG
jgi:threonylcarbamoyladenosine tRNA methylthiotransferase MtaB